MGDSRKFVCAVYKLLAGDRSVIGPHFSRAPRPALQLKVVLVLQPTRRCYNKLTCYTMSDLLDKVR